MANGRLTNRKRKAWTDRMDRQTAIQTTDRRLMDSWLAADEQKTANQTDRQKTNGLTYRPPPPCPPPFSISLSTSIYCDTWAGAGGMAILGVWYWSCVSIYLYGINYGPPFKNVGCAQYEYLKNIKGHICCRQYNWTRVGTLYQNEAKYSLVRICK